MATRKVARKTGASSARRILTISANYSERHVWFCFEDAIAVSPAWVSSGCEGDGNEARSYSPGAPD